MNGVQDPFSRLVVALDPWLDQVVIVGGWAHQLYRRHPAAQELDYPPLTTLDTDVAVPLKLPVREQDIRARLLAHGFTEESLGNDRPQATHYYLGDEASGFYVEFLTPLIGGEYDRKGRRKATTEVAGVSSQRLRHVELLLHHPWSIDFKSDEFAGMIQIANPVSFVAQKVLIHEEREREDRAIRSKYSAHGFKNCRSCGGGSWLPIFTLATQERCRKRQSSLRQPQRRHSQGGADFG